MRIFLNQGKRAYYTENFSQAKEYFTRAKKISRQITSEPNSEIKNGKIRP